MTEKRDSDLAAGHLLLNLKADNRERVFVPCVGCIACCKNELVILHAHHGDNLSTYERTDAVIGGVKHQVLKRRANGDCVYLGASGCTIWNRAPAQCRSFDCRTWFLGKTNAERREAAEKHGAAPILDAGRKRVHTIEVPKKEEG